MKIRQLALLSLTAIGLAACAQADAQHQDAEVEMSVKEAVQSDASDAIDAVDDISEQELIGDPTPEVVDWDGRWSGVIPCGDCPGIEVDVILNTDGTYIMRETKLERYEPTRQTEGQLTWDTTQRVLTFNSPRGVLRMRMGEGEAVYLGQDGEPMFDHILLKQAEYRAHNQQLILPLQSIRVDDGLVFFSGLLNFKETQQGGFKSVKGETVIDCATENISFKNAKYYTESDAMGERIVDVSQLVSGSWTLGANPEESVLRQVADTFCPR